MPEINNDTIIDNSDLEIAKRIKILKAKMEKLYEEKGTTDKEVLDISIQIDMLINRFLGL